MSVAAIPTSIALPPRGRGNSENRGRTASKAKHRNILGQQLENPTPSHPGKSVGGPQATPRKPLALIDHNTKPTPAGKGQGSGKPGKKSVRNVERRKQSGPTPVRPVTAVSAPAAKNEEMEEFPEIETMSRRQQEPDELDIGMFVPPAYFRGVSAAVRQPLILPPFWGPSHSPLTLSSPLMMLLSDQFPP
ncbi:hypothetical protein GBAR_LOCUS30238 [Geodia barretti]|uniref:Uncharacterized protein n=1 Tax=Geodia barretti TaxID=519541 RepID=A0AA35TYH9_GEOBA|nr:hypothetical protein GBAR_LOCUS30238 [Geodia barretti]